MVKTCVEYVWYDDMYNFRSKCKVYNDLVENLNEVESWDYDGSSTKQSVGKNTEIILEPVKLYNDPFRGENHKIVLCDTYYEGLPTKSNMRYKAKHVLDKKSLKFKPWFGMEQEYFILDEEYNCINKKTYMDGYEVGKHYCGIGNGSVFYRDVAERHLRVCMEAGVKIDGINAEVVPGQWEFQIGPCEGIDIGDDVMMARYLLQCVAEDFGVYVTFEPKPFKGFNGSGCHTNFSTKQMREGNERKNKPGVKYILDAVDKLEAMHKKHMNVYGEGNDKRMSGEYETSSYDKFSFGIGRRDVSVRVSNRVAEKGYGYFEDRRPASNCNPYEVAESIYTTCCLK